MDEVRRFLRYTLPGIACTTQLLVAFCVTDADQIHGLIRISGFKDSIAIALAGLLASGGLGYMFAIIYFAIYWRMPLIDHRRLLVDLRDKIHIESVSGHLRRLTKRTAWAIATRYWYSKHEHGESMKEITPMIDRLVDVTHALGSTIVGTVLAAIAWAGLHYRACSKPLRAGELLWVAIPWILLLGFIIESYRRTLEAHQSMFNSTLAQTVAEEYESTGRKVIVWFSD